MVQFYMVRCDFVNKYMGLIGCVQFLACVSESRVITDCANYAYSLSASRRARRTRMTRIVFWSDKVLFKRLRQTLNRRLGVPNSIIRVFRVFRDADTKECSINFPVCAKRRKLKVCSIKDKIRVFCAIRVPPRFRQHARADGTRSVPATVTNTTLRVIRVIRDADRIKKSAQHYCQFSVDLKVAGILRMPSATHS